MASTSQRFAGKHAVVTGGGSGIGRAIALRLGAEGAEVTILEARPEAGEAVAAEIRAGGGSAGVVAADVTETEAMRVAFERIERLEILADR
jgi:NAD(P)-dependent dehydrogenase (short-subunit alcohol dehydrogenase family)